MSRLSWPGWREAALFLASPLAVFAFWEACGRAGWLDLRFFPLPSTILLHTLYLLREDTLMLDIAVSTRRIALGLALGFLPGALVGLAMGLSGWVRAALGPLVALAYPIPKIAILPLLLLVFGLGELSNVMVVAIGVFFLALINTYAGVRSIGRIHFDVARVYRIPRWQRLLRIVLPGAMPGIFTGLKLSVGYGLILIVAAEMVAAGSGLGYRIWMSWETWVIEDLYSALGIISLLGVLLSVLLEALERVVIHWHGE